VTDHTGSSDWFTNTNQGVIVENSGIRTSLTVKCPMLNAAGTIVTFSALRAVTTGMTRVLRVNMTQSNNNANSDGIIGAVFGYLSSNDYYRFMMREIDGCMVIQHVMDNVTTLIATGNGYVHGRVSQCNVICARSAPNKILSNFYNVHITYGAMRSDSVCFWRAELGVAQCVSGVD
jgi:hypothetical protein